MTSPLSPRLLAGFGALLLVIGTLGVLALSLMDDLNDRSAQIARENSRS